MGLFSKIFGRRESDGRGGVDAVVPVHPGWAFVESVFADLYPSQTPKHAALPVAPSSELRLGRASVEGTHVYDAGSAWHYVTLGLTDLYDQSDASIGPNAIRCELSMRVAKRDSAEPPLWPVAFLGKIASHVRQGAVLTQAVTFRTGAIPGAPADAGLEGVIALADPKIEPRPGPFGKVGVILLVGVTGRELDEMTGAGTAKVVADIAADPARQITAK
ncbi:MAG TPA: suppressor of fused domain protein [Polyangia bacterium]